MDKLKLLVSSLGSERVKVEESLYYYTYLKCEGRAESLYIATSRREFVKALEVADELGIPYFVIGSGTKVMIAQRMLGLVIKNRTSAIKTLGIKGKVGRGGIDVDEAIIEADSGVSLNKLNEFLQSQSLQDIKGSSFSMGTLGGAVFIDTDLQRLVSKVIVWEKRQVLEIDMDDLNRKDQVVLGLILKAKKLKQED